MMAFDLMYEAMKRAVESEEFRALGLKTASQNIVYCKQEPYFWSISFFEGWKEQGQAAGTKYVRLDLSMKYCHYDELQYSIIYPGQQMKFSNKLRANSKQKCRDRIWSKPFLFPWDEEAQDFDTLAAEILRTAVNSVKEILEEAERLGGLDKYFIAHPEINPRLSAFACIEQKQYKQAYEILKEAGASKEVILVHADTEERLTRLRHRYTEAQGSAEMFGRDYHDIMMDYCYAMAHGFIWNEDMVLYSFPQEKSHVKRINDYIEYVEPSQVPLSAAVYLIKGEQNTYIYDVGRAEEAANILAEIDNKVIILSHYHGDHSENIDKLDYKQLYVGDLCGDTIGKGRIVPDMLKLSDGVELCIRSCPSVHVGGSLILNVNQEYCLLGDVHLHRATFDSATAWQMLAVLKRIKCKYFLVSHGEQLVIPKEELIRQLEEEYQ